MRSGSKFVQAAALAGGVMAFAAAMNVFAAPGDTVADRVFGQAGSFTSNTPNNPAVNAASLYFPSYMVLDSGGRLYVADWYNNRVLEYDSPLTSQSATHVFGQAGNFATNACNSVSPTSLCAPTGVALDASGRLYVADSGNNRVVVYDSPLTSQSAARVFGQPNLTSNGANSGGVSASSLSQPYGVALDGAGRLYVVDTSNYRVLEFDTPLTATAANRVFGQAGSFATNDANHGGVSANSFDSPTGIAVDAADRLYVADEFNNRVLAYDNPLVSQTATRVFGQSGSFTSVSCAAVSAASLCLPTEIELDAAGRLYISDWGNSRVLGYNHPVTSQVATQVLGQAGSFSTGTSNNGGVSASSLNNPCCVARGPAGSLYVADWANHRVLEFDAPLASVGGIAEEPDVAALRPAASSDRSHAIYFVCVAALLIVAVASAAGWRRRES